MIAPASPNARSLISPDLPSRIRMPLSGLAESMRSGYSLTSDIPTCDPKTTRRRHHMRRLILLAATIGTLAVTSTASAATPIYWTPAKMAAALTALQYPHAGTLGGACKGTTAARHGTYAGFRCTMTWQITGTGGVATTSGKVTAWAKPLRAGRVCGSTVNLRACKPLAAGPLAGDPTVCNGTPPTTAEKAHDCAQAAAKAAVVAKHGQGTANLQCAEQQDVYHWACTSLSGPFTVTFTKGVSAWATTVTP